MTRTNEIDPNTGANGGTRAARDAAMSPACSHPREKSSLTQLTSSLIVTPQRSSLSRWQRSPHTRGALTPRTNVGALCLQIPSLSLSPASHLFSSVFLKGAFPEWRLARKKWLPLLRRDCHAIASSPFGASLYSKSGRTHVSMILPVTTYGSMFDAGRRSSKYPLFSFSVIRGMRTYKRRRWGDGEATEQGAAARARGRGRYGKGV